MNFAWVKALVWLAVIVAVLACVYAYGQQQYGLGEKAERALWLAKDNAELSAANAKIKYLEEKYRQQEQDAADAIAVISHQYQEDLKHVKTDKDRVIADLRGGSYRLFIPVTRTFSAYGGSASEVAATSSRCDGEARAELSTEAAEFLVGIASEADEVVKQLGACQAVINADRDMGISDVGNQE